MSRLARDLLPRVPAFDSIGEMESAREDRYWDALSCATEAREFVACYLLGYVVEMTLKTAYFRFSGVALNQPLTSPLQQARRLPGFRGRNLHDLMAWAMALIDARQRAGQPLDPYIASAMQLQAARIAANWAPSLRYKASVASHDVVEVSVSTAEWFRERYADLWS